MNLWRRYRALPLPQQFIVEWAAFGVVCVVYALVVIAVALLGGRA